MKIIITACFWVALSVYCLGQKNSAEFNAEDALHFLPLPNGGKFIIDGVDRNNAKITYISPTNSKVWEKPFPYPQGSLKGKSFAVASPDSKTFYFGEYNAKDFTDKKLFVSVFTVEGDERRYVVEGTKAFGKTLLSIFCDNSYMFLLASANQDELGKKMKSESVVLSRFSKENFGYKKVVPELPPLENADKSTFWSIIGVRNGQLIFSSKMIDTEIGRNKFTIVEIDPEGKAMGLKVIETVLANKKYTRPSLTTPWGSWLSTQFQLDYFTIVNSHGMAGYNRVGVNNGAYGHLTYDLLGDCFYAYGLFGPTPMKKIASVYEGFYVHKYDGNCNELWKLQEIAHRGLSGEAFFRIHGTPGERTLALLSKPDNTVSILIGFKKVLFPYTISPEGKAKALSKIGG